MNLPDPPPDPTGHAGQHWCQTAWGDLVPFTETRLWGWGQGEEGSYWLLREELPTTRRPTLTQPGLGRSRQRLWEIAWAGDEAEAPADMPCPHGRRPPPRPTLTLFFAFCCSTDSLSSVASFSRHHTCDSSSMRLGTDSRSLSGSEGLQPPQGLSQGPSLSQVPRSTHGAWDGGQATHRPPKAQATA